MKLAIHIKLTFEDDKEAITMCKDKLEGQVEYKSTVRVKKVTEKEKKREASSLKVNINSERQVQALY